MGSSWGRWPLLGVGAGLMQELGREAAASTQMLAEKEQKRKEGGERARGGGEVGTDRRENSEAEKQKDGGDRV